MSHADDEFDRAVVAAAPRLYAFAVKLSHDHHRAEDLVQATLLRALMKREQFEPGTNLLGWLFTILRNDWFNFCRKRGREVSDPDGVFASQVPVGEGQSAAYDLKIIRKRMRMLNRLQRDVIEIVAINGYQYDEAAEMLGVPVGTVKSSVSRARQFLETGEEPAGEEEEPLPPAAVVGAGVFRAEQLYRAGAAISEIAQATGLSRSDVMALVSDRKLKRAA